MTYEVRQVRSKFRSGVGETLATVKMYVVSRLVLLFVLLSASHGCTTWQGHGCTTRPRHWPVVLTDFINSGNIAGGLNAARIAPLLDGIQSYAGYFRHNLNGTNILVFFWYFPAEETLEGRDAPVIFWVGGPPISSLVGMFYEHGPISLGKDEGVVKRQFRWSKYAHVVYIDVMIYTGFSYREPFTNRQNMRSVESAGDTFYQSVVQFFHLFPKLSSKVFFAGDGYASKIVLYAARKVLRASQNKRETTNERIKLRGLYLASAAVDPGFMVYGQHLAQHGLIDMDVLPNILETEKEFVDTYKTTDFALFSKAFSPSDLDSRAYRLLKGFGWRWPPSDHFLSHYLDPAVIFYRLSKEISPKNYLKAVSTQPDSREIPGYSEPYWVRSYDYEHLKRYLSQLQDQLYIPSVTKFETESTDAGLLNRQKASIWYSDVRPILEEVLEHYQVLFYNGQLDVYFNYPNVQRFANSLQWSGSSKYKSAKRTPWYVKKDFAGFVKTGGNLSVVMVRDAGQMMSKDQPGWVFHLIVKFFLNQTLATGPTDYSRRGEFDEPLDHPLEFGDPTLPFFASYCSHCDM